MVRRPPDPPPAWTALTWAGPVLPPPLNHLYQQVRGGGKIRNPAVQRWQAALTACLAARVPADWPTTPTRTPLLVVVGFTAPNIHQWDLDGRCKVLFDALAAAVQVDDRYFVYVPLYKARGPLATRLLVRPYRPEDLTNGTFATFLPPLDSAAAVDWLPGDAGRLAGPTADLAAAQHRRTARAAGPAADPAVRSDRGAGSAHPRW